MINTNDLEISRALNVLEGINENYRFQEICKLNAFQKAEYKQLLDEFERLNKLNLGEPGVPANIRNLKGKALENLVEYLLQISGGLFEIKCNLRTSTNEIDNLITLSPKGKTLIKFNLIDSYLNMFLGECKNYKGSVSVTYVGKFCSLLLTNNVKLGIMFSYHGITGSNWSSGAGLVKKFYLHKENVDDRFCIIDFSINEFRAILSGKNLIGIIQDQIRSLQFDTDFSRYIATHPAE